MVTVIHKDIDKNTNNDLVWAHFAITTDAMWVSIGYWMKKFDNRQYKHINIDAIRNNHYADIYKKLNKW